jgi:hypothetical protein
VLVSFWGTGRFYGVLLGKLNDFLDEEKGDKVLVLFFEVIEQMLKLVVEVLSIRHRLIDRAGFSIVSLGPLIIYLGLPVINVDQVTEF